MPQHGAGLFLMMGTSLPASFLEKILALVPCLTAIFYRMVRAVVITGEARQARTVMLPHGFLAKTANDVERGAYIGADATLHALGAIHAERLVSDEITREETTEEARVEARPVTDDQIRGRLPLKDEVGELLQLVLRLPFLLHLLGLGIHLEERQSDIRLRHDEREGGVELQSAFAKVLPKDVDGLTDVVASGTDSVEIMPLRRQRHQFDETPHNLRRPPTVNREAQSDALALLQLQHLRRLNSGV